VQQAIVKFEKEFFKALTIRQVRHFIAAAETGRVSAAAAGLNVTQSAVTASLKGLEAEVGRKLFDRHSNGVTLTFDGHNSCSEPAPLRPALQMRCPRRWGTQVDGTVDVAVSYTVAGYFRQLGSATVPQTWSCRLASGKLPIQTFSGHRVPFSRAATDLTADPADESILLVWRWWR
jgi:Bacterial regulatory helix-turn-helix protein, lysR family